MKINKKLILCVLLIVSVASGCKMLSKMMAKGGTEFRVQIDTAGDDKEALLERAIKITQNKIDAVGMNGEAIKDPNDSNVFIVRIYGSQDLERTKKFLFTAYQLELRKIISPPSPSSVQMYTTAEAAKRAAIGDQEVLSYPERLDSTGQFVIVDKNVIINGEDIQNAQAVSRAGSDFDYQISFTLNRKGAARFGDWTGKNINNYLAVVLDKKVQSVAYIRSQIFDSGEISGRFTKQTAEDIAMSLKSGYLPATLTIVEEKQIGN